MAKNSALGKIAVLGGIVAAGSLLNRKRKKKAAKEAEETKQKFEEDELQYESEMLTEPTDADETVSQSERKCPVCGSIDTTGAPTCPVCFSRMDPSGEQEDFYDEI